MNKYSFNLPYQLAVPCLLTIPNAAHCPVNSASAHFQIKTATYSHLNISARPVRVLSQQLVDKVRMFYPQNSVSNK